MANRRGRSGLIRLIAAANTTGVHSDRQVGMCTSKVPFKTHDAALQDGRCRRAYECPYCGSYHGTNSPATRRPAG